MRRPIMAFALKMPRPFATLSRALLAGATFFAFAPHSAVAQAAPDSAADARCGHAPYLAARRPISRLHGAGRARLPCAMGTISRPPACFTRPTRWTVPIRLTAAGDLSSITAVRAARRFGCGWAPSVRSACRRPTATLTGPPPYRLVDNRYSLSTRATSSSSTCRAAASVGSSAPGRRKISGASIKTRPRLRQFIQRYMTNFNRWNSPKFSVRRVVRDDAFSRALGVSARPGHRAQRHRAALVLPQLRS